MKIDKMPADIVEIILQGNRYKTTFTVGRVIDVERYRAFYSGGMYSKFTSKSALDLVDCIAFLTAFFPDIEKDKGVKSILDLNPIQMKEIINQIDTVFMPWYHDWLKVMSSLQKEELKEEAEGQESGQS